MNYSQFTVSQANGSGRNNNCPPSRFGGGYGRNNAYGNNNNVLPGPGISSTSMYSRPAAIGGNGPYTTMSTPNTYYAQQQQQQQYNGSRQQVGRSCGQVPSISRMSQQQMQQQPQNMRSMAMMPKQQQQFQNQSGAAAPNPYNTACAPIRVNVSAATLAAANNTPAIADRGESSVEGNPSVKYIPLNWEDILGGQAGMNGMRVSMVPSGGDPSNQSRQLKIAFGGGPQPQSGETPLRVVSFQPVTSGRMEGQGSSSAGAMKQNAMNFTVGGQLAAQQQQNNSRGGCPCSSCQGANRR